MGYMHSPLQISTSAIRMDLFDEFIKDKNYDKETKVGIILFEDSGIGGYAYDEIEKPDFSKREDVLNHVEKESLSKIEKIRGYSDIQKATMRCIFEKMKADETLYKSVVSEYQKFLDNLTKCKTGPSFKEARAWASQP